MNNKRISIASTVVVNKKIMAYKNGREYELKFQRKGTVIGFISGVPCDIYQIQFTDGTFDYIDEKDIAEVLDSSRPLYTITLPIEGDELETDAKQLD